MTCYSVYLYDKDNDDLRDVLVVSTEEQARTIAEALEVLIKKDMIVNRFETRPQETEPFDWVEIWEYSPERHERIAVYPEK